MYRNHVIDIELSSNAASFGEVQCSLHNKFARAESSATPEYTYMLAVASSAGACNKTMTRSVEIRRSYCDVKLHSSLSIEWYLHDSEGVRRTIMNFKTKK